MGGIYGWKKKETGEIKYVGKTTDFDKRLKQHQHYNKRGRCSALYDAFDKYGIDAFEFVILQDDITDPIHMQLAEGQWARDLETLEAMGKGGYNLNDPWNESIMNSKTSGMRKSISLRKKYEDPEYRKRRLSEYYLYRYTEEYKQAHLAGIRKRSENKEWRANQKASVQEACKTESWKTAHKEAVDKLWADPEFRAKNRAALIASYGTDKWKEANKKTLFKLHNDPEILQRKKEGIARRNSDPEWQKMMSDKAKKMWENPEYREKQISCVKECWKDPEYREKCLSGLNSVRNTEEYKKTVREGTRMRTWRNAKPIVCVEYNLLFECAKYAEDYMGAGSCNIVNCCKGIRKTAKGLHWRYATEEETRRIKVLPIQGNSAGVVCSI